jgi:ribosomal protein L19
MQHYSGVHDVARSNVELTQSKNKEYYDKKTKLPNFKVGDRVFLKVEKVEIGKKKKYQ